MESDPQLIGLIGMIWHVVIDQQVETSVPCVTVPVRTVAELMLYLFVTSEEPFSMLIMTFPHSFFFERH